MFGNTPWLRPALFALGAVAVAVKAIAAPYTVAYHAADWTLNALAAVGAGSLGQSNSGLTKK